METSGLFGGGYLSSYYDDGATYKVVSSGVAGVILDVQEKGFFSIQCPVDASNAIEVTIDGKSMSLTALGQSMLTLVNVISTDLYSITIPFATSLKVEITNYNSGTIVVRRIS